MAENSLIYYMLKNEKVLNMVENSVGYFPDKNIRDLSNEIIYYFHILCYYKIRGFIPNFIILRGYNYERLV